MRNRKYPKRPFIGVGVCVFDNDRVLLVQRRNPPRVGSWSLPGGIQEIGETIEDCALREVKEETGLEITSLKLIDVVDSIIYDALKKVLYHYTLVDFSASVIAGKLSPGDDAIAVNWFSVAEIRDMDLWSETERIILEGFKLRKSF
jgi:ADP-ribose pyrophosphatase YjhB (NUDIX family)